MSGDPKKDADASPWQIWLKLSIEIDRAAQHGVAEMAGSTWRVLVHLATRRDDTEDIDAIGERCSLSAASVSRALAELEEAGYVDTRRSNEDARMVERTLTTAGRAALGRIEHSAFHPSPNIPQSEGDSRPKRPSK